MFEGRNISNARGLKRWAKLLISFLIAALVASSALPAAVPVYAGNNGVYTKLVSLKSKFPDGRFWNHQVTTGNNNGDQLMARGDESYANTVTTVPCATHHGTAAIGQYDCNYFDGGIQCMGFAKKVFYDIFGQRESQLAKRYDTANLRVGDYVRINNNGHSGVVLSISGNSFTLCECNFDGDGAHHNCWIRWGYVTYNKSCITYFKRASNYDQVNQTSPAPAQVSVSWNNVRGSIGTNDATIYVTPTFNRSGRFTAASGTLYDENGNYLAKKTEGASHTGTYMNIWYAIKSELGKTLTPGTKYYIVFTTTFEGATYTSPYYSFTTSGTKPAPTGTTSKSNTTSNTTAKKTATVNASKVTLNKSIIWIKKGKTYTLKAVVAPANTTNKKVTWSTSKKKVATVSSSGKVKAKKRGSCYITVKTANGKKAKCRVIVW